MGPSQKILHSKWNCQQNEKMFIEILGKTFANDVTNRG